MTSDRWGVPVELGERRLLHPGMLKWLRALGWMVALTFIATLPAGLAINGLDTVLPDAGWAQVVANSGGALVCLAAYGLAVWLAENRTPDEISLRALPGGLAAGLAIGLLMFSAVMAIMAAFGLYDMVWQGAAPAWESTAKSIQSGVMEEIVARAVILRLIWAAFGRRYGPWIAFAAASALFGAGHLANPNSSVFAAVCIAVEAGIMLGAFYALTGRLWVSIGVHAAWNFAQGYIFGAAVSGTDFGPHIMASTARAGFPEWLTGGGFGPEASLPGLFIGTLVGVVVMWMAWKAGRFAPAAPATLAQAEAFS